MRCNRSSILCLAASGLLLLVLTTQSLAQDPEPPQTFQLTVDGETYDITEDQEIEIESSGKAKIRLTASPTRNFTYGGFNFLYPTHFSFECEHTADSRQWVLDGNDVVIMIFAFTDVELSTREFAESLKASYDDAELDSCSAKFGGKRRSGTELRATVEGEELTQQVFDFPTKDGTRLFIIQDILIDKNKHTPEHQHILKLLDKSFRAASDSIR